MSLTRLHGTPIVAAVVAALPVRAQEAAVALDLEPIASWTPTPKPWVIRPQVEPVLAGGALVKSTRGFVRPEIEPVLAGGRVLVSSTLRLFAVDARTCALAWSAGPPQGWDALTASARDGLFAGLDPPSLRIAPAAGEHVAVAALQVPVAREKNDTWQGIDIQKTMPERRLFAFELDTGCPLWDHAPPRGWDGRSGTFEQRMRVVGSPLVAGGRVLVPCTYDGSSIDYWVACYELATGRPSWRTFVKRGQIERHWLGGQVFEFNAAPLVLDASHGRAIAQTGLGLVAALDLDTGEIAWRAEYAPIQLPKARSYSLLRRNLVWRTTPPMVAGNTLLATPLDSDELLALDLATGDALWKHSAQELAALDPATKDLAFDHLAGIGEGVLYLGGFKLSALALPAGFRSPQGLTPVWTRPIAPPGSTTPGRVTLAGDALFLAAPDGCLAFDRRTGEPRTAVAAGEALGLRVSDEALFLLTANELRRIER